MSALLVIVISPGDSDQGTIEPVKQWLSGIIQTKMNQIITVISDLDEIFEQTGNETRQLEQYAHFILNNYTPEDLTSEESTISHLEKFTIQAAELRIRKNEMLLDTLEARTSITILNQELKALQKKWRKEGFCIPGSEEEKIIQTMMESLEREKSEIKKARMLESAREKMEEMHETWREITSQQEETIARLRSFLLSHRPSGHEKIENKKWYELWQKLLKLKKIRDQDMMAIEIRSLEYGCQEFVPDSCFVNPFLQDSTTHQQKEEKYTRIKEKKKNGSQLTEKKEETLQILQKIWFLEPAEREDIESVKRTVLGEISTYRLDLLMDHLKIELSGIKQRAATEKVIREELIWMGEEIKDDHDSVKMRQIIDKAYADQSSDIRSLSPVYRSFFRYLLRNKSRKSNQINIRRMDTRIMSLLEEYGYRAIIVSGHPKESEKDLDITQETILSGPIPGYGVIIQRNQFREYVFRFIRISEKPHPTVIISESDEMNADYALSEWNFHYNTIVKHLQQEGYSVEEKIRRGLHDVGLPVLIKAD